VVERCETRNLSRDDFDAPAQVRSAQPTEPSPARRSVVASRSRVAHALWEGQVLDAPRRGTLHSLNAVSQYLRWYVVGAGGGRPGWRASLPGPTAHIPSHTTGTGSLAPVCWVVLVGAEPSAAAAAAADDSTARRPRPGRPSTAAHRGVGGVCYRYLSRYPCGYLHTP